MEHELNYNHRPRTQNSSQYGDEVPDYDDVAFKAQAAAGMQIAQALLNLAPEVLTSGYYEMLQEDSQRLAVVRDRLGELDAQARAAFMDLYLKLQQRKLEVEQALTSARRSCQTNDDVSSPRESATPQGSVPSNTLASTAGLPTPSGSLAQSAPQPPQLPSPQFAFSPSQPSYENAPSSLPPLAPQVACSSNLSHREDTRHPSRARCSPPPATDDLAQ